MIMLVFKRRSVSLLTMLSPGVPAVQSQLRLVQVWRCFLPVSRGPAVTCTVHLHDSDCQSTSRTSLPVSDFACLVYFF